MIKYKIIDVLIILTMVFFIKVSFIMMVCSSIIYYIVGFLSSKISKNRLNYLYTFKKHAPGKFELQYNPPFGFHWIEKEKVISYREDAIFKLKNNYQADIIFGLTMTLHSLNTQYKDCEELSTKQKVSYLLPNMILTFINLRNLFTLSFTRKIYKMVFINKFVNYTYYNKEKDTN